MNKIYSYNGVEFSDEDILSLSFFNDEDKPYKDAVAAWSVGNGSFYMENEEYTESLLEEAEGMDDILDLLKNGESIESFVDEKGITGVLSLDGYGLMVSDNFEQPESLIKVKDFSDVIEFSNIVKKPVDELVKGDVVVVRESNSLVFVQFEIAVDVKYDYEHDVLIIDDADWDYDVFGIPALSDDTLSLTEQSTDRNWSVYLGVIA